MQANSSHQRHSTLLHRRTLKIVRDDSNFSGLRQYHVLSRSKSTRKGIFPKNGEVIDQKFEFAEVKIRRAISLVSDIVTLRRLLHWIAWSFRYQIDLSIVEFAQEMIELRRYYWPADFRSYMIESLQSGNKGLISHWFSAEKWNISQPGKPFLCIQC